MNLRPLWKVFLKINVIVRNLVYIVFLLLILVIFAVLAVIKVDELAGDYKSFKSDREHKKRQEQLDAAFKHAFPGTAAENVKENVPQAPQKKTPTLWNLWEKKLESYRAEENSRFGAFQSLFDSVSAEVSESLHIIIAEKDSSGRWITDQTIPFAAYWHYDLRSGKLTSPVQFSRLKEKETETNLWTFPNDGVKNPLLIGIKQGDSLHVIPSDSGKVNPSVAKQVLRKFSIDTSVYCEKRTKLTYAGQFESVKRIIVEISYRTDTTDTAYDYGIYGVADFDTSSGKTTIQFISQNSGENRKYLLHTTLNQDGRANVVVFASAAEIELFVLRNGKWIRNSIYIGEEY